MNPLTAELMWSIPRVGSPAVSDQWIVVPVSIWNGETTRTRLWRLSHDGRDVDPLTSADTSASKPVFSPDGSTVAFVRKHQGTATVHVMAIDGGEANPIEGVDAEAIGALWSPGGERLYVLGNARGEEEIAGVHVTEDALYRYWDRWLTNDAKPHLFEVALEDGSVRDLTPTDPKWMRWENTSDPLADIAVSETELVYCALSPEPPFRELRWSTYSIDLATGIETELTPDHAGHTSRPRFDQAGDLVVGVQSIPDYYADPVVLTYVGPDGLGEALDFGDWDRSPDAWEWKDGQLLLTAEDSGTVRMFSWSDPGDPQPLTTGGSVNGFDAAGDTIFVSHSSLVSPPELFRVSNDGLERLTHFTADHISGIDLPHVSEFTVTGSEGADVQTYLLSAGQGPRPLVHMIHGGPHSMFGDQWHWRWNAAVFAGAGYNVALVNFAGSTSFGDEFTRSIHGAWGKRPMADIEAVTDHLIAESLADPERIAIAGGSYGGYLVSWLITQTTRYRCAIAHAAVTDLPGMYASDITMGRARAYGAEAWQDPGRVQRWSPMSHAADISTPTLVMHGDKDYRVPVGQGLELYGLLHAKGVSTRLVHFEDEGHWILDGRRSLIWYREVTAWLNRYLGQ